MDVVVHDDEIPQLEAETLFCGAENFDELVAFFWGVEMKFSVVAPACDVIDDSVKLYSWHPHDEPPFVSLLL